jgi:hypothetical protein
VGFLKASQIDIDAQGARKNSQKERPQKSKFAEQ